MMIILITVTTQLTQTNAYIGQNPILCLGPLFYLIFTMML